MRSVEILREGQWVNSSMRFIKAGDHFKLYEPNGMPVVGPGMVAEWVASEDAKENDNGIWEVQVKDDGEV